ncbi:MAG: hypothetical protein JF593_05080 [Novosphingobium sp.]|nr:hypothetical protein [Novosphingobium sp.]
MAMGKVKVTVTDVKGETHALEAWFEKVGSPNDIEFAMLDMVTEVVRDTSRLSCQIKLRPELDGLEVTVAPNSVY